MADHQITPKIWVVDGATADEIAVIQAMVDALDAESGFDPDTRLDAAIYYWFRAKADMPDAGELGKAWGYTPEDSNTASGHTRSTWISRGIAPIEQLYTAPHEYAHHAERDKLANKTAHDGLMALMEPSGPNLKWNHQPGQRYEEVPNETFADAFPRIYMPLAITRPSTGKQVNVDTYQKYRKVPKANYAAYKTIVGAGAGPTTMALAAAAHIGDLTVTLTTVAGLDDGEFIKIAAPAEVAQVKSKAGVVVTLQEALTADHANGATVTETSKPTETPGEPVTKTVVADVVNGGQLSALFDNLPQGITGQLKVRAQDSKGAWGEFSDPVQVSTGVVPEVGLFVANLVGTNADDTEFTVTIKSKRKGGDAITGYRIRVVQPQSGGTALRMTKEEVDLAYSTTLTIPFTPTEGISLSMDQIYWCYVQIRNIDLLWSPELLLGYVPTKDIGPIIEYEGDGLVIDPSRKINELIPVFRLYARNAATIDGAKLQFSTKDGSTVITTQTVQPGGGGTAYIDVDTDDGTGIPFFDLGQDVQIIGWVRGTGASDYGAPSEPVVVHFDAAPGKPAPLSVYDDVEQLVQRVDGMWIGPTDTPIFVFPNRDTDRDLGFDDNPTRREIELRNAATNAHLGASPYVITAGITDEWQPPSGVIPANTPVKARARYDDDASVRGPFSDYLTYDYTPRTSLTDALPANGDIVVDPTPDFTWTFGAAQIGYRLLLEVGTDLLYDSLYTETSESLAHVPQPYLDDGMTVNYTLWVYNENGLATKALGTFSTSFTVPDALENLTVTPDVDSFIVTFDASTDAAAFEEYIIEVRVAGEQWRVARRVPDIDDTSVVVRAVARNVETLVRVTQSNGWRSSEPLEGEGLLGGPIDSADFMDGAALVRPEIVVELPGATVGEGDTKKTIEQFSPPHSEFKTLLDWGTTGFEVPIELATDDHDLLKMLRDWKRDNVVSIFKTYYGDVRYVRIVESPEAPVAGTWFRGRISLIEVSPESVDF